MFHPTPYSSITWTVTDITKYLRSIFNQDQILQDIWVIGEVSNFSRPSSGHIYFTIKDVAAALRCVMWRTNVIKQKWLPNDGDAIEIHGSIDIYETGGQYQLYADSLRPAGEGFLYQKFLRLKAQLSEEGLFAPEIKKMIPPFPKRIGIITSPTSAALRDILTTLQRRFPIADVYIAPTAVQGEEAVGGILSALKTMESMVEPDVIIIARGGGSIEDLWSFNEEAVARAIAACNIPTITGIGHETDFTIADFVSDLRAPTPTAAAELATPNKDDLLDDISEQSHQIYSKFIENINYRRSNVIALVNKFEYLSPKLQLRNNRQRLDELFHRLITAQQHRNRIYRITLNSHLQKLSALNPSSILERGYAIVSNQQGELIKKTFQVTISEHVNVQVSDGIFSAVVNSK